MTNKLMTTDEMASYLKMHVMTIYKLLETGEIPALKVGRKWRFKKETIDEWVKKKEEKGLTSQKKGLTKASRFINWDESIIDLERREEELFDVFDIDFQLSTTVYRPK